MLNAKALFINDIEQLKGIVQYDDTLFIKNDGKDK
jgi:hypothetical protein